LASGIDPRRIGDKYVKNSGAVVSFTLSEGVWAMRYKYGLVIVELDLRRGIQQPITLGAWV
jgi:hypothetical protein